MEESLIKKVLQHLHDSFKVKNLIIIEFKRLDYPRLAFYINKTPLVEVFEGDSTFLSDIFVIEKHALYAELVDGYKIGLKEIVVGSDRYLLVFEAEDDERVIHLVKKLARKTKKDFEWKEDEIISGILNLILTVKYAPRKPSKKDKSS